MCSKIGFDGRLVKTFVRFSNSITQPDRRFWIGWGASLLGTALVVGLVTLPPFLGAGPRTLLMDAFAPVCHQIPARSPHLDGVPLAVCHRCYGLYWGLFLGAVSLLWVRRWDGILNRRAGWVLLGALAVPGADWLGDVLGCWMNTPGSRMLTGGVLGLAAGYYLARAVVDGFGGRIDPSMGDQAGAGTEQVGAGVARS